MEEISKDELWEIYGKLPEDLKEAIFSEDTSETIWNICKLYDVEQVDVVAKIAGRVLMGLLPPELFEETLRQELKLNNDISKKVAIETEHFLFTPLKDSLDFLYKEAGEEQSAPEETTKTPEEDTYREPVD